MALKQVIVAPGLTNPVISAAIGYFASFSGTSYSAQLEVNAAGDWVPAAAPITQAGNMPAMAFAGRPTGDQQPVSWRWNVTAITGTLTVYLA